MIGVCQGLTLAIKVHLTVPPPSHFTVTITWSLLSETWCDQLLLHITLSSAPGAESLNFVGSLVSHWKAISTSPEFVPPPKPSTLMMIRWVSSPEIWPLTDLLSPSLMSRLR